MGSSVDVPAALVLADPTGLAVWPKAEAQMHVTIKQAAASLKHPNPVELA
jgi:hypothetical protein